MTARSSAGNFFEDFALGQELRHATPRTVTTGDATLYTALYGSRFALQSSDTFARSLGYPRAPIDGLLVFHIVFGRTVPDISLNAIANLGYAGGRFGVPVFPGDTLSAASTVIGLKQNSNGKTGVVYVRSVGRNQLGEVVLDYIRWVMIPKRDADALAPEPLVPELPAAVRGRDLVVPPGIRMANFDTGLSGSRDCWEDYEVGERIDHVDGTTIEEADHMLATRLYQNTARVHFNLHAQRESRFGRRIVYGGHIISIARALSVNGLANAFQLAAINGGRHVNPAFAGDTVYAWSEIIDRPELTGHSDVGALRIRTVAVKDRPCAGFPDKDENGGHDDAILLEFDYTVLLPRRI